MTMNAPARSFAQSLFGFLASVSLTTTLMVVMAA
jgi:hypothetical protein